MHTSPHLIATTHSSSLERIRGRRHDGGGREGAVKSRGESLVGAGGGGGGGGGGGRRGGAGKKRDEGKGAERGGRSAGKAEGSGGQWAV